jgi:hypothetical protein
MGSPVGSPAQTRVAQARVRRWLNDIEPAQASRDDTFDNAFPPVVPDFEEIPTSQTIRERRYRLSSCRRGESHDQRQARRRSMSPRRNAPQRVPGAPESSLSTVVAGGVQKQIHPHRHLPSSRQGIWHTSAPPHLSAEYPNDDITAPPPSYRPCYHFPLTPLSSTFESIPFSDAALPSLPIFNLVTALARADCRHPLALAPLCFHMNPFLLS